MLNWFAKLWEIDSDEYWGYVTNCGTEGNLHGVLVGRENLPDGFIPPHSPLLPSIPSDHAWACATVFRNRRSACVTYHII